MNRCGVKFRSGVAFRRPAPLVACRRPAPNPTCLRNRISFPAPSYARCRCRFPSPLRAFEEARRTMARHRAWRSDERTKSRCPSTRNRSEVRTRKSSRLLRPGDSSRDPKLPCAHAKNFADAIDREAHAEIQWLAPRCACAVASDAQLRACVKPRSVKMQAPSSMKHEDGADVWKIFARGENPRDGMIRP